MASHRKLLQALRLAGERALAFCRADNQLASCKILAIPFRGPWKPLEG